MRRMLCGRLVGGISSGSSRRRHSTSPEPETVACRRTAGCSRAWVHSAHARKAQPDRTRQSTAETQRHATPRRAPTKKQQQCEHRRQPTERSTPETANRTSTPETAKQNGAPETNDSGGEYHRQKKQRERRRQKQKQRAPCAETAADGTTAPQDRKGATLGQEVAGPSLHHRPETIGGLSPRGVTHTSLSLSLSLLDEQGVVVCSVTAANSNTARRAAARAKDHRRGAGRSGHAMQLCRGRDGVVTQGVAGVGGSPGPADVEVVEHDGVDASSHDGSIQLTRPEGGEGGRRGKEAAAAGKRCGTAEARRWKAVEWRITAEWSCRYEACARATRHFG